MSQTKPRSAERTFRGRVEGSTSSAAPPIKNVVAHYRRRRRTRLLAENAEGPDLVDLKLF